MEKVKAISFDAFKSAGMQARTPLPIDQKAVLQDELTSIMTMAAAMEKGAKHLKLKTARMLKRIRK